MLAVENLKLRTWKFEWYFIPKNYSIFQRYTYVYLQGFRFALDQDNGLDRRHAELVIRELAKFHAISYCMKNGSNENLLNSYPYLGEDSLYRPDTSDFTKRTITPVMASLAELLRNTKKYEQHYEWFVELARNFHDVSTHFYTLFLLEYVWK